MSKEFYLKGVNKLIDLYILTGFLGAGKTTLLKNIINDLHDKKVGVIQNEFGKKSIDGDILKNNGIEMLEINRGSIFCSCLKISFVEAMNQLAEKELDYLFVESSGLADPSNINEILEAIEATSGQQYNYKGAICLVDAVNFLEQLDESETVARQVKHSHLGVINKIDLVDQAQLDSIYTKINGINSNLTIQETTYGKLHYEFLNEDLSKNRLIPAENTTNTPDNKPKTLNLTFSDIVDKDKFNLFISEAKEVCHRIKGFIQFEDGWYQVDTVNKLYDYKKIEETKEESNIVLISKIGRKAIRPIVSAWKGHIGKEMKLR